MFKLFLIAGLAALLAVAANATLVNECDEADLPISVDILGCDEEPCDVVRGSDVLVNVTFEAPNAVQKLVPDVLVHALGISMHHPVPEPCDNLITGKCPLAAGDTAKYQLRMPILAVYPLIPVELTFTMKDEGANDLFCFGVTIQVVNG